MTDLITAEEAQKLLDGTTPGPWEWAEIDPDDLDWLACEVWAGDELISNGTFGPDNAALSASAPDLARTVIALHAELAQARADTQAAVALVVEKAAETAEDSFRHAKELGREIWAFPDLRVLAPVDAIAEVAKLRVVAASEKELSDAYLRIRSKLAAWDTKPGGVDRFEVTESALDRLAAENAALQEQVKGLVTLLQNLEHDVLHMEHAVVHLGRERKLDRKDVLSLVIRTLAAVDGLAEVAKLRAELLDMTADRDSWKGEAGHWMDKADEMRAGRLAADNAAQPAAEEGGGN